MRKIKVLILEDDPGNMRIPAFKDRFSELFDSGKAEVECDYVEHAVDCNRMLQENEYDMVLLDHDLGGEEMCGSNHEDCGSRVVDFLLANPMIRKRHGVILVHSLNHVAGPLMAKRLGCHWAPGLWFKDEWNRVLSID